MGKEKPPKPAFVIKATMAEDPYLHRKMSSAGGRASAKKRAEGKRIAAEQEAARLRTEAEEQARIEEEREILDIEARLIMQRDAFAHDKAISPPKDD